MIFILIAFIYIVFTLSLIMVSAFLMRIKGNNHSINPLLPVSIIIPLKGISDSIKSNLIQTASLQHLPGLEVIFVSEENNDPGFLFAQSYCSDKEFKAKFVVAEKRAHWQPKTNNLDNALNHATYDNVIFADDDMALSGDLIQRLLAEKISKPDFGAVYAQPFIEHPEGTGGYFHACFINFCMYILHPLLQKLGFSILSGNVYLISKNVIFEAGGLESIKEYISDDLIIGKLISKTGRRIYMAAYSSSLNPGKMTFREFISQHVRWLRVWRLSAGKISFLGFVYSPLFLASGSLLLDGSFFNWMLLIGFSEIMLMTLVYVFIHQRKINIAVIALTPVMLFIQQILVIISFTSNKIQWRSYEYTLGKGGKIVNQTIWKKNSKSSRFISLWNYKVPMWYIYNNLIKFFFLKKTKKNYLISGKSISFHTNDPASKIWFYPRYLGNQKHHESAAFDLLIKKFPPKGCFFDIGANLGWYTCTVAKLFETSQVFAFEMDIENFDLLQKNIQLNDLKNVLCYHTAITDKTGIGTYRKTSFMPTSLYKFDHLQTDNARSVPTSTISIDDFCEKNKIVPDMIKIDVEGGEVKVLQGMKSLLSYGKTSFIIEVHPAEVAFCEDTLSELYFLFRKYNYEIFQIKDFRNSKIVKLERVCYKSKLEKNSMLYIPSLM